MVAHPRARGAFTLTDRRGRWGSHSPEDGRVDELDPWTDGRLPALAVLSGHELLAYRIGRRAVLRTGRRYAKVTRPASMARLLETHAAIPGACPNLRWPDLHDANPDLGLMTLDPMSGLSMHQRLRSGRSEATHLHMIRTVGESLAGLHDCITPAHLEPRTPDSPERWVAIVGRVDPKAARALESTCAQLPRIDPGATAVIHGDLHDKNVFISTRGVGLIDLDSMAIGHAEEDMANLGIHLVLRALQSNTDPSVGEERARQLHGAYREVRPLDAALIHTFERHTWFRLACLYRFRRRGVRLVAELLRRSRDER